MDRESGLSFIGSALRGVNSLSEWHECKIDLTRTSNIAADPDPSADGRGGVSHTPREREPPHESRLMTVMMTARAIQTAHVQNAGASATTTGSGDVAGNRRALVFLVPRRIGVFARCHRI